MLNLREALSNLDGKTFDFYELRQELQEIRTRHLAEFPVDFTVTDLLTFVNRNQWLIPQEEGKLLVSISPQHRVA
jgi:hypothetical protein